MKFIIIFGPSAVGKMTVGQALAEMTGMKLYHNHLSIEAVLPVFGFGTPQFNRLVTMFRLETMKEAAKSDLAGLIFTFVWALNLPSEEEYIDQIVGIFEAQGAEVFYVELEASLETRLIRNKHEKRLLEKPSKRNLGSSESVLYYEEKYQLNTKAQGEFSRPNYLKINNENLEPMEVAWKIIRYFDWDRAH